MSHFYFSKLKSPRYNHRVNEQALQFSRYKSKIENIFINPFQGTVCLLMLLLHETFHETSSKILNIDIHETKRPGAPGTRASSVRSFTQRLVIPKTWLCLWIAAGIQEFTQRVVVSRGLDFRVIKVTHLTKSWKVVPFTLHYSIIRIKAHARAQSIENIVTGDVTWTWPSAAASLLTEGLTSS